MAASRRWARGESGCGGEVGMRQIGSFAGRLGAALTALTVAAMTFAGSPAGPFTGSELDTAPDVVNGFLTIGALVTIALAVYRLGKRGVSRV